MLQSVNILVDTISFPRIVFKQLSGQQRSEIIVILRDLLCDWGALTFFSQEELHVLFRLLYTSLGAISETWGCDLLGPEAALPTLRWRYEALSIWSLIRSCVWKVCPVLNTLV